MTRARRRGPHGDECRHPRPDRRSTDEDGSDDPEGHAPPHRTRRGRARAGRGGRGADARRRTPGRPGTGPGARPPTRPPARPAPRLARRGGHPAHDPTTSRTGPVRRRARVPSRAPPPPPAAARRIGPRTARIRRECDAKAAISTRSRRLAEAPRNRTGPRPGSDPHRQAGDHGSPDPHRDHVPRARGRLRAPRRGRWRHDPAGTLGHALRGAARRPVPRADRRAGHDHLGRSVPARDPGPADPGGARERDRARRGLRQPRGRAHRPSPRPRDHRFERRVGDRRGLPRRGRGGAGGPARRGARRQRDPGARQRRDRHEGPRDRGLHARRGVLRFGRRDALGQRDHAAAGRRGAHRGHAGHARGGQPPALDAGHLPEPQPLRHDPVLGHQHPPEHRAGDDPRQRDQHRRGPGLPDDLRRQRRPREERLAVRGHRDRGQRALRRALQHDRAGRHARDGGAQQHRAVERRHARAARRRRRGGGR